jgi:peptidyl-prolyl cis-trans isomerase A (cyclophilin A)
MKEMCATPGYARFQRAGAWSETQSKEGTPPRVRHAGSVRTQALVIIGLVCLLILPLYAQAPTLLLEPDAPEMNRRAPEAFQVRLETSKGLIVIEVQRAWSPHGADRFYNLVRAGYYDQVRFHRIRQGHWAQFGINGDPQVAQVWRTRTIPDDPRRLSNQRGTLAFAFAVPNGRTTQVFINLRDNAATHDAEPFAPFGRVIEGMNVADALYADYGEAAGGGIRAGKQGPLFEGGNAYLERNFPRLDYIIRATVVERK